MDGSKIIIKGDDFYGYYSLNCRRKMFHLFSRYRVIYQKSKENIGKIWDIWVTFKYWLKNQRTRLKNESTEIRFVISWELI